jgi:ribose transport system ATP-binding protein
MNAPANLASPLLELDGVSKSFPGVKALDDVSLTLRPGEVHALLGENGAGKSTLIKIICGVYRADEGSYRLEGRDTVMRSAQQALAGGIGVVHQERTLVPTFTVAENILLDRVVGRALAGIDHAAINHDARAYMELVGLHIAPDARVESLSPAQKQLIEIARALSLKTRILLLDEPTASISLAEADALLETIRQLRARGVGVLYVTHKLEEVFAVADTVTVLRDGRNAAPAMPLSALDQNRLIELMIGRSHDSAALPARKPAGEPVLEAVDLRSAYSPVPNSFVLRKGEILGWYGLVGAGRTELARVLIGADPAQGGTIRLKGNAARIDNPRDALRRHGIGYVSESRQEEGLFLTHTIARNVAATTWDRLRSAFGLLNATAERSLAERFREKLGIRMVSPKQAVGNLSGGNQQKVSVAKWLAFQPGVLIFDEPTVGIDVATKFQLHELIHALADGGISIILISSDMPEIVRVADRILVFRSSRIVDDLVNDHDYAGMSPRIMRAIVGEKTAGEKADG